MGSQLRALFAAIGVATVVLGLGAVLAEVQARGTVTAAAAKAADAAMAVAAGRMRAQGPIEADRSALWAGGQRLDDAALAEGTGFEVRLSTGTDACLAPDADRVVFERGGVVSDIGVDGTLPYVERCEGVRDRHDQLIGMIAVRSPAADWLGSPWSLRAWLWGAIALALAPVGAAAAAMALAGPPPDADAHARAEAAAAELRAQVDALETECAVEREAHAIALDRDHAKAAFLARLALGLAARVEALQDQASDGDAGADGLVDGLAALRVALGDVVDLTRLEAGHVSLAHAPFEVRPLVAALADDARHAVGLGGNTLDWAVADDVGAMVGDAERVRQILANLVSNAAKYTRGGAITVTAAAAPVTEGDAVRFEVRDTGAGMSPEQLGAIFGSLHPLEHSAEAAASTGLGLGLPLVKALVERMGGGVTAASGVGEGTTFTVVLPRAARE